MGSAVNLDAFGQRLRSAREARGLTLEQVADLAGLSKAHLSRLESGERQASIGALVDLSTSLGVSISSLLGEDREGRSLATFGPDAPRHRAGGLEIATCSGYVDSRAIEALRVTVNPRRPASPPVQHRGEEFLYVLRGTVELEYDGALYELSVDTSAHFDASRPHRMSARRSSAEVLLVSAEGRVDLSRIHH
jgi:transcriptional regulator with XRE-family HTH domain